MGTSQEIGRELESVIGSPSSDSIVDIHLEKKEKLHGSDLTKVDSSDAQVLVQEKDLAVENLSEPMGLADVKLLSSSDLLASQPTKDGKKKITLNYTGKGLLKLKVFSQSHIIFQVPEEIINSVIDTGGNLTLSYEIPFIGELIKNKGKFDQKDIHIDRDRNLIYVSYSNAISLALLDGTYSFSLEIELDTLPLSSTGQYVFYADMTNDIIQLSILSDEALTTATLESPILKFETVPQTISFQATEIGTETVTIPRENPEQTIKVSDTRGEEATWKVQASISEPLTAEFSNNQLRDALVYIGEDGESQPLSEDSLDIYLGDTGSNQITDVWSKIRVHSS